VGLRKMMLFALNASQYTHQTILKVTTTTHRQQARLQCKLLL
jgi:hypothetical protein